jgi:two-component system sensor histidine kinase PilS (NtrC family)
MSAGLAHEIRNPLASLRSAIQEIGASFPPDSQDRQLADIVIAESDRLDRIIGRFLDFSREGELRLSRLRLGPVLEGIRAMLLRDGAGRGLDVIVTVKDDPEIRCDADRVKEVFFNLALNAAQACSDSGGRLEFVLEAAEKAGVPGVEVSFKDNGRGISEQSFPHLFEPFYSNREGGTGMGLALSRKQVNMHGGDIMAANLEGGGACFRVWLPLEPVVAREPRRSRRPSYTEIIRAGKIAEPPGGERPA